jgi:hypothetical protein
VCVCVIGSRKCYAAGGACRCCPRAPGTELKPGGIKQQQKRTHDEASCGRRGSTPRAINSGSTLSVACVATLPSSSSLGDCEECGASSALGTAVLVEGGGIKTKTGANYRALRPARLSPVLSARAPGAELNQGAH